MKKRAKKNHHLRFIIPLVVAIVLIAAVTLVSNNQTVTGTGRAVNEETNLGLVAYYKFNEWGGLTAHDPIGDNHGDIESFPLRDEVRWTGAGRYGSAIEFKNTSDAPIEYFRLENSILNQQPEWTFTAWVYPQNDGGMIYSEGRPAQTFKIRSHPGGSLEVKAIHTGNGKQYGTGAGALEFNKWNFIAITLKNGGLDTGTLDIYITVDGTEKEYHTDLQMHSMTGADYATFGRNVGSTHGGTQGIVQFNGKIDEVKFYHKALTRSQIDKIKADRGIVANYKFENDYKDSKNDYDGSITTGGGDLPAFIDGVEGKAISFKEGDKIIKVPNTVLNEPERTNEITMAALLRVTGNMTKQHRFVGAGYAQTLHYQTILKSGLLFEDHGFNVTGAGGSDLTIEQNIWYYVVQTWDGHKQKIYVNGDLIKSVTRPGDRLKPFINNLFIGGFSDAETGPGLYKVVGDIDELQIYNKALTEGRIKTLSDAYNLDGGNGGATCSDSDESEVGGEVYYTAGTVTYRLAGETSDSTLSDSCAATGNNLTEYYCDGTTQKSEEYECPNGCSAGECTGTITQTCTDTDSGQDEDNAGTVTYVLDAVTTTYADNCTSSSEVREYYCEGNVSKSVLADCGNNEVCDNGACVEDSGGECTTDSQCADDEFCSSGGLCILLDCVDDDDCFSGEICEDNQCVEDTSCDDDSDCRSDEECVDGECESIGDVECIDDLDCENLYDEGWVCNDDGECVEKSNALLILSLIVLGIIIVAVIGFVVYILIKKDNTERNPSPQVKKPTTPAPRISPTLPSSK